MLLKCLAKRSELMHVTVLDIPASQLLLVTLFTAKRIFFETQEQRIMIAVLMPAAQIS